MKEHCMKHYTFTILEKVDWKSTRIKKQSHVKKVTVAEFVGAMGGNETRGSLCGMSGCSR